MSDFQSDFYAPFQKQRELQKENPNIIPSIQFAPDVIEEIGRASLVAVLDLLGKNPYSRVHHEGTRQKIIDEVMDIAAKLIPDPKPKAVKAKKKKAKKKKSDASVKEQEKPKKKKTV